MNIILFDTAREHGNLLPLTFTRPVADLRLGIDTLREKWEALLPGDYSYLTAPYLSEKYPSRITSDNIYIAGHLIATPQWAEQIASLQPGEAIADDDEIWAYRGGIFSDEHTAEARKIAPKAPADCIRFPYDLFGKNGDVSVLFGSSEVPMR